MKHVHSLNCSFLAIVFLISSCGMQPSGGDPGKRSATNSVKNGTEKDGSKAEDCKSTSPASGAALFLADETTYESDIKGIINTKCAWCHSSTAKPGDRHSPWLTTYEEVKSRFESSMEQINDGKMPPKNKMPQLAAGDAAKLQAWKDGGFLKGEPVVLPDPANEVYYEGAIQKLLMDNCNGCHGKGGQPPQMDTYDTAKTSGKLSLTDIENNSMPKAGPLAASEKELFKKWVEDGMLLSPDGMPTTDSTAGDGTTAEAGEASAGDTGSAGSKCN